jgi:serine/threonine protein kinase
MSGVAGHGWQLGDYIVAELIDQGEFGSVFHATNVATSQRVALKLIPLTRSDSPEKVAAEQTGARLQQEFGRVHPNLVPQVFEHGPIGKYYAIAMEYVEGAALDRLVADGRLPPDRAARIALAVCDFLRKAHEFQPALAGMGGTRIVHGDLKPQHVLVVGDAGIRVLDFGIAKALESHRDATVNLWGPKRYLSPERLQSGGSVNEHADFWCLGLMLFEMVAGYHPYRKYTASTVSLNTAVSAVAQPEALPADADQRLAAIIRKLLAPQPEHRYPTAAAIAQDLECYLRGEPTRAEQEDARAGQETVRIRRPGDSTPRIVPPPLPTLPIPPDVGRGSRSSPGGLGSRSSPGGLGSQRSPGNVGSQTTPGTRTPRSVRPRTARGRRLTTFVLMLAIFAETASEGISFVRAALLRPQVASVEAADIPTLRREYESIGSFTPLGLARPMLLNRAVASRMREIGDRTILDFRSERPTVVLAQWQEARQALEFAHEVAPGNDVISAKLAYTKGQIERITADDRDGIDRAIALFQQAARLDPKSPDPYLGLARIAAYSTRDADALTAAIDNAARRGYTPGRRERIQLGDVYKVLADRARADAARPGADRDDALRRAADAYGRCVDALTGVDLFDSEAELRACQQRQAAIEDQLGSAEAPPDVPALPPPPDPPSPDESAP